MIQASGSPLRLVFLLVWMVLLGLTWRGRFGSLDESLWDRFQRKLPAPSPSLPVTLVGFDDASVAELGSTRLSRSLWARALEKLDGMGARALVLDVFFQGPQDEAGDRALGDALEKTRAIVPFELSEGHFLQDGELVRRIQAQRPAESLRVPRNRQGFANLPVKQSRAGVYRRVWLVRDLEGDRAVSLGLRVAEDLGAEWGGSANELVRLDFRPLRSQAAIEVVSLADLLAGRGDLKSKVEGRVCFLGATSPQLGDIKDTPLGQIPGALMHATVAENLLGRRMVRQPGLPAALLLVLPALWVGLKLAPTLWFWAGAGTMVLALVLGVLASLLGIFLPAGAGCFSGGLLLVLGILENLRPKALPRAPVWKLPDLYSRLEELLLAGDLTALRLLVQGLPGEQREEPLVRLYYARSLAGEGREGLLEKALEGSEDWEVPWEARRDLARVLEEEGFLELALGQWEWLYRRHAGKPGIGDSLFRLRAERDGRWGVLSPRALRDLLGWSFRNLTPLAEGGEALLFTAQDKSSGAPVVIKVLHPRSLQDPEALKRFCNEARLLSELHSPHIPRLLGEARGRLPYLVLEHCPGTHPEPGMDCQWFPFLLQALGEIHQLGWVHRDLHPGNLLVDSEGTLHLFDFGLACKRGEIGPEGGTPGYASPEQLEGEPATEAQDVFSLGNLGAHLGRKDAILEACRSLDPKARPSLADLRIWATTEAPRAEA